MRQRTTGISIELRTRDLIQSSLPNLELYFANARGCVWQPLAILINFVADSADPLNDRTLNYLLLTPESTSGARVSTAVLIGNGSFLEYRAGAKRKLYRVPKLG